MPNLNNAKINTHTVVGIATVLNGDIEKQKQFIATEHTRGNKRRNKIMGTLATLAALAFFALSEKDMAIKSLAGIVATGVYALAQKANYQITKMIINKKQERFNEKIEVFQKAKTAKNQKDVEESLTSINKKLNRKTTEIDVVSKIGSAALFLTGCQLTKNTQGALLGPVPGYIITGYSALELYRNQNRINANRHELKQFSDAGKELGDLMTKEVSRSTPLNQSPYRNLL